MLFGTAAGMLLPHYMIEATNWSFEMDARLITCKCRSKHMLNGLEHIRVDTEATHNAVLRQLSQGLEPFLQDFLSKDSPKCLSK
ncbi:hypothetical protein L195_g037267, partial [Trifolium pratense]